MSSTPSSPRPTLPRRGLDREAVRQALLAAKQHDVPWREGRVFSLVYWAGEDVHQVAQEAYTLYFAENGLNPTAFPSLRRLETEVVAITADLLHGPPETVGNMTSGGTESILMAVKAARDWARAHRPVSGTPEMVLSRTAHPAFDKAAHYFGLRPVYTPVGEDYRADVAAMAQAITSNTILLVASAPAYPHGLVDPIPAIGRLAQERDLLLHVDACVGGFMLPFVERLGYPVPTWDFRVPGVTSISVDLHKYGYAAKGASLILFRRPDLRRAMFHVTVDWPGGIYASATISGTRPGGAIAAAWAVLHYLGEEGYLQRADAVMRATRRLQDGIQATRGLRVVGDPEMSVLALAAEDPHAVDVYALGDELGLRGWYLDRQQNPPSLHMTVHYGHVDVVDTFLADLWAAAAQLARPHPARLAGQAQVALVRTAARLLPEPVLGRLVGVAGKFLGSGATGLPRRSAAMYGMMAELPNRGDVRELVADLLDRLTRP